ncbi:HVA22-like protein k isoform X2 [Malus sylvestris]|uniref:HVA22-like protein k isoform X2 n=1 Tax=Malus sylvestris TaxID=3752 RepID=UPI0021AC3879|nr:HVA22-like protein k isoform X2 [Malus sylvestris]
MGIGLPVYCTCQAIERKVRTAQEKWLLYWAAYGSFSLVEIFSDKLISWCPMYYHMKFAFLVWLQLPTVDGAKQLYTNHLRPFFLKHQAIIDRVLVLTYSKLVFPLSLYSMEQYEFIECSLG